MEAIKLHKIVEKDGEISLKGLPCHKGENVELILLIRHTKDDNKTEPFSPQKLLGSKLNGVWKDRDDIADSNAFARRLRESAQSRSDQI